MDLESLVSLAQSNGASDLHLEAGLPAALRSRGTLRTTGEPIAAKPLLEMARAVIGEEEWERFLDRRSIDLSKTLGGVRCRINILQTSRGIGFAIRLLATFQATIEKLNLHPDLKKLIAAANGLILVSGATGSGKSSTLAALIQEINLTDSRHIVTVESPIEYTFRPSRAYIRQREVGRDTPSFEQALIDALREDPDVLMVGEMRDPETMRLTLNASETGHLVLATVHSSTCIEALQRIANAFPPELEILSSTFATKNCIRTGEFFKIPQFMETAADQGMWTWQRYQSWLEKKRDWQVPDASEQAEADPVEAGPGLPPLPP